MKTHNDNFARQAIVTRYLAPTNVKGARIVAECERGKVIIDYPHEFSGVECHIAAVSHLLAKFRKEDGETGKWGTVEEWVVGGLPRRSKDAYCFVLVRAEKGGAK